MRFACLGSGSRGNAWLVEAGSTRVMLDCGFSLRETDRRLLHLGYTGDQVDAVVLTHEHTDHARGAARFAARHGCEVWLTRGTLQALEAVGMAPKPARVMEALTPFCVGDLELTPYPVPHDAREPVQYVLSDGRARLGVLTDAGHVTEVMRPRLDGCDALVLECNHDLTLLQQGDYPPALKARIRGPHGHLDNGAAAGLLAGLDQGRLQHVVAAHLSEKNNTPALARAALAKALGCRASEVDVANQQEGLAWRQIG